ncbi:MAG: S8 family serine peptidase [Phycisphaerae bacterium]|nr:S8 family serine peptidase [Phycisphaerae bacterium]
MLELKAGRLDTAALPNLLAEQGRRFDRSGNYVIQLDGPMSAEREAALRSMGVTTNDYLPHYAWTAKLDGTRADALANLGYVRWVGAFDRSWKIDPELGARTFKTAERLELVAAGRARVAVSIFAGDSFVEAATEVLRLGGVVNSIDEGGTNTYLDATLPANAAARLADLTSVQFVEDAPEASFRNDSNRWILQSNVSGSTPVWNQGIRGEGQVGGLIDGGVKESHCMFDDTVATGPTHRKIIGYHGSTTADTHGTHTAGTFVGDNNTSGGAGVYNTNDGMAFNAKLSFTNLSSITSGNLESSLGVDHGDGARVHSNSWGDDSTRAYTTWCRQIDSFSRLNEDSLVLFAVSNGSISTTPENAKNCVGVGASMDTPSQGSHCSGGTGPTLDGRRKPEIYAPGCSTVSANSATTCGTTSLTGTSMACPAVSGAGLLVRQYYTDGFYPTGAKVPANGFTPTGALIKATLMNSGVDMTGITGYPSNQEGWGRVLLDNALYFTGDARKLLAYDVRNAVGLTNGQTTTYTFTNNSAQALELTLVFTDQPGAVNASNPVVNNLDLEVTDPSNNLYRGNVFSGGQSSTGGATDAKNSVEMVLRTSPTVGQWSVTVRGTSIPSGAQGYALVISGDVSTCTAPAIAAHPSNVTVSRGQTANFTVGATGTAPLSYQWKKGVANVPGGTNATLSITNAQVTDAGSYSAAVSNACGNATSNAATLTVCIADFNGDTSVDDFDYFDFLNALFANSSNADVNNDGSVDDFDYFDFLNALNAGC